MPTKRAVEILTAEEVRALVRACSSRASTGVRNAALIAVMFRGGLRISEALKLRVKDFDPQTGTLRILHLPQGLSDVPLTYR